MGHPGSSSRTVVDLKLPDEAVKRAIEEDPDFVNLPRFGYSLRQVMARYPDGVPEKFIRKGLGLTEAELESMYEKVLNIYRERLNLQRTGSTWG